MRLRGCGDGKRGDSEAEVGRGGSFFGAVSPTRVHQATRADLKKNARLYLSLNMDIEILGTLNVGGRTAGA